MPMGNGEEVFSRRLSLFWSSLQWLGLEHLIVEQRSEEVIMRGLVVALLEEEPQRIRYEIRCRSDWVVRSLVIDQIDGRDRLALLSDEHGHWRDENGHPILMLDGCTDVDLSITPATNTIPIRRLGLEPGQSQEITAAYVEFPTLRLRAVHQRYTHLDSTQEFSTYRYASHTFRTDLTVDAHGLVLDYPGIWRRRTSASDS